MSAVCKKCKGTQRIVKSWSESFPKEKPFILPAPTVEWPCPDCKITRLENNP